MPTAHREGAVTAGERGTVLMLVPAGFLVLVLLAALAVDSAVAYQAQQQLHDELAVAATDAVSSAVDRAAFYAGGTVTVDGVAAEDAVCRSMASQGGGDLRDVRVGMTLSGTSIRLEGVATVGMVFGAALPGFGTRSVRAEAQAALESAAVTAPGGAGGSPAPLDC